MKGIYLDYAAATPVGREVMDEMLPFFSEEYANPGSSHFLGVKVKEAVENARSRVAKVLNCLPSEIFFAGSGTESVNIAIKGVARALKSKGNHIITSNIEHPAVLETCKFLEKEGFEISYIPVDNSGVVSVENVKNAVKKNTVLISIMYVNNEIGTIQPVYEISRVARENNIFFHTDACQAGLLELDVGKLSTDLLTLNGSKIYAPKGSGVLFVKEGVPIIPVIHGGGQENNLRSGTHNVPAIIGFTKALELLNDTCKAESERLTILRDYFIKEITKISGVKINGSLINRIPNNVNACFENIEASSLLSFLEEKSIFASAGSACATNKLEPSHVLKAIGLSDREVYGSARFSFGKFTTKEQLDKTLGWIKKYLEELKL